jgi:hypothetical protein
MVLWIIGNPRVDNIYRLGDFFFNSGPQTNSNCVGCVDRVLGVLCVHLLAALLSLCLPLLREL